jgi:hypothetical protein
MTLEFHKLTAQVDQMGEVLAAQQEDIDSKVEIALQILEAHADEAFLPYIHERVQDAIDRDAGYRGARPLDEPVMNVYAPAPLPESATVVATDGSQINPDAHGPALYYLLNFGTIIVHHGSGEPPVIASDPYLFYEKEYMITEDRGTISSAHVAARRTVNEMGALAEYGWHQRGEARPLLSLIDGPLLLFGMGAEVPDRDQLRRLYFSAMDRLYEVKAGLAGYTDRPRSRYVVGLLHLLDLQPEEITRATLASDGRLEGLPDIQVFGQFLRPAQRTALFVQMSPINKAFRGQAGVSHEIAFFYMNVANGGRRPHLARVEVPMWVAEDRALVAELQALIYHQCHQVASRYPYVLTRAHELAIVKHEETQQLNTMIRVTLTRHGLDAEQSEKQSGKDAVAGARARFEIAP